MWESIIGGEVGVFDDSCAGTMAHSVFTQAIDLVESDSATHVGRSRSGRVRGGVAESAGEVRNCALNEASNGGEVGEGVVEGQVVGEHDWGLLCEVPLLLERAAGVDEHARCNGSPVREGAGNECQWDALENGGGDAVSQVALAASKVVPARRTPGDSSVVLGNVAGYGATGGSYRRGRSRADEGAGSSSGCSDRDSGGSAGESGRRGAPATGEAGRVG